MSDAVIEAIAGATGAAFATLITYPISTVGLRNLHRIDDVLYSFRLSKL